MDQCYGLSAIDIDPITIMSTSVNADTIADSLQNILQKLVILEHAYLGVFNDNI
jgi:hypothetical protein